MRLFNLNTVFGNIMLLKKKRPLRAEFKTCSISVSTILRTSVYLANYFYSKQCNITKITVPTGCIPTLLMIKDTHLFFSFFVNFRKG